MIKVIILIDSDLPAFIFIKIDFNKFRYDSKNIKLIQEKYPYLPE